MDSNTLPQLAPLRLHLLHEIGLHPALADANAATAESTTGLVGALHRRMRIAPSIMVGTLRRASDGQDGTVDRVVLSPAGVAQLPLR